MGLIKTIKESFARARALGMQAKAELEEAARCRAMTRAEARGAVRRGAVGVRLLPAGRPGRGPGRRPPAGGLYSGCL